VSEDEARFWPCLKVQVRVIKALLMREVITRYGRHNIGFLWFMLEPIMFCTGVVILWHLFRHSMKVEITPFIVTGYSALLLWRNCGSRGLVAMEPNRSLLHHRVVTVQDIFFARMTLEIAGVTAAFLLLFNTLLLLNLIELPKDLRLMIAGWLLMAWFSACLGMILGCLGERSEVVERVWHPLSYLTLTISGTFFMVDWLPPKVQKLALWVPMVNPIEMMRAGYWGDGPHFHYRVWYISFVCLTMSLVALLLMSDPKLKRPT
jgi:capsular polysaccharide transport system permease protein